MVDSRLRALYADKAESDPEQRELTAMFAASMGPEGIGAVLDGACTLIYMYMKWLQALCEQQDEDVVEYVVPAAVGTMRMMPKSVRPEVIPTMAGLLVAAGTGLSPNLWRAQHGPWTEAEMSALEATVVLLAERMNRITDDRDFAVRMIAEALSLSEQR
jgi:hypothetical protein